MLSRETEAVICWGMYHRFLSLLFASVMEGDFMMGSMGSVVGEKITRLFEFRPAHILPVIGYTVSAKPGCRRVSCH